MTATTWSLPPKPIAPTSPVARRLLVKSFYVLLNWGARTKIPEDAGDFRLLSPRAATRCGNSRAQPFLQGLVELDRLSPVPDRLRAGTARRRPHHMEYPNALIGLSLNGLTAFSVAPLRFATMLGRMLAVIAFVTARRSSTRRWSMAKRCRAIRRCLSASWCSAACN